MVILENKTTYYWYVIDDDKRSVTFM